MSNTKLAMPQKQDNMLPSQQKNCKPIKNEQTFFNIKQEDIKYIRKWICKLIMHGMLTAHIF
jgi:hypothetical protein